MCSQRSSKQRILLNLPISAFYPHFSVLSPFQCFIPISAFYPHFSVLSPFQRFIPISAFYPHFSVLSPFQFPLSVSVSAIQFQRFIPTRQRVNMKKFWTRLRHITMTTRIISKIRYYKDVTLCENYVRDFFIAAILPVSVKFVI